MRCFRLLKLFVIFAVMNKMMPPVLYPVGIQSFAELRRGGYVYVDKTELIHKIVNSGKYYFLSRPRRFGKSLLLSTIEAYYLGHRDLFNGLAIDSLTEKWEPHPVLHFDFNTGNFDSEDGLNYLLNYQLSKWEELYGSSDTEPTPNLRLGGIIQRAYEKTGKKVVVLVDEYDKPLLNSIDNDTLAERHRSVMKALYANLKTMDPYIEFAMLTGVARFSKVSIFSDLNNLRDISFEDAYSSLCGITNRELDVYFHDGIKQLASTTGKDVSEIRQELRERYDGYHFSENSEDIYNPFSIVNVFASERMGSYWFESGTPTYLVKLLQQGKWRLSDLNDFRIKANTLMSAGIATKDPIPVLYQTGYLTIKGYDSFFDKYILDYPNREVKMGFMDFLLPYYVREDASKTEFEIERFVTDVMAGNIEDFMTRLSSLMAGIPYQEKGVTPESQFQNAAYLIFTLMGFYTTVEDRTSDGRIDLTVETSGNVYIFEFKIDKTAQAAIDQIERKRYWEKFLMREKKIFLIGANFNTDTRRLDDYIILPKTQESGL